MTLRALLLLRAAGHAEHCLGWPLHDRRFCSRSPQRVSLNTHSPQVSLNTQSLTQRFATRATASPLYASFSIFICPQDQEHSGLRKTYLCLTRAPVGLGPVRHSFRARGGGHRNAKPTLLRPPDEAPAVAGEEGGDWKLAALEVVASRSSFHRATWLFS